MSKRKNKYEQAVNEICEAAQNTGKALTYQQALSIHLRSQQLVQENNNRTDNKEREIEECYRYRYENYNYVVSKGIWLNYL